MLLGFSVCLFLTGCADAPMQQASAAPPSVSQMQGICFSAYKKFSEQVKCMESSIVSASSSASQDSYVQEYIAYMHTLSSKVKKGAISGDEARLTLTQKLNELKQQQQAGMRQQEAIESQRTLQTMEILKQNAPKPLEFHPAAPSLSRPVTTNCQASGNQVYCTSN
jgi:hypothetical protein